MRHYLHDILPVINNCAWSSFLGENSRSNVSFSNLSTGIFNENILQRVAAAAIESTSHSIWKDTLTFSFWSSLESFVGIVIVMTK